MQNLHRNGEPVSLLGDSGYPQRPWLMTPYNNPAPGSAEETYNELHTKARVIVENTFGRLKNRWRCLCKDRVLHYKPLKCAQIVTACSVLHNIALDLRVPAPQDHVIDVNQMEVPWREEQDHSLLTLGRLLRDQLARRLHGPVT
nr:putative nuclease HARBI1 isoform X2 [Vanessa tameamea]